jgi:hypothetical protein
MRFNRRGYRCYAPGWPLKDVSAEQLRAKHPDKEGEGKVMLSDVRGSTFQEKTRPQYRTSSFLQIAWRIATISKHRIDAKW